MADVDWATIREEALHGFTSSMLPPTMELPALPHAVTAFIERSESPDAKVKELAGIVETDTGLTMELLRYVNSTYVGLRHKANNVQQAVTLLGLRQSKMFLIQTGMQAAVRSRESKFINQSCFWNASLQKALFAREVAKLLKVDETTAFAGGLLQDFLLPVLTNELTDPYVQFVTGRENQPKCIVEFEKSTCGFDHALASAGLAHRWGLPDDLVCCILFHHRGLHILADKRLSRSVAAAVALSALLPDMLRQHFDGLEQLVRLQQKWGAFDLMELAEIVDEQHEEMGMGIRNDFPLTRRCRPVASGELLDDGSVVATALA